MWAQSLFAISHLVPRLGKPWVQFHAPLLLSKCAAGSSPHVSAFKSCCASLPVVSYPHLLPGLHSTNPPTEAASSLFPKYRNSPLFGRYERNKRNLSYGNIITSWFQDMRSADAGWMNHSLFHLGANSKLLRWTVKKSIKRLVIANFSKYHKAKSHGVLW